MNPWGISHGATPFWVSDNGTGLSTLYNGAGAKHPTIVTVSPPGSAPTGQVFNGNNNVLSTNTFFLSPNANPARFIFATEGGTISGWNPAVNPTNSIIKVDNSPSGAVYKGLARATNASGTFLYAANFHNGTIDVFDSTFASASGFTGKFLDPNLPSGYAPFNVQSLDVQGQTRIIVSYALQDAAGKDDVPGVGHGFVDVFDTNGNLITRLISDGVLNSPWGLDIAPGTFGQFANDLLVGNFGDGTINVFDPLTGALLGTLTDSSGKQIVIEGLWALTNGDGANGAIPDAVYFTAGIDDEMHGLFGDLTVAAAALPEPGSLALLATGIAALMWFRGRRPVRA